MTSPAGAEYAMQVMPGTASNPGYGVAPAQNRSAAEYDRVGRQYRAAMFAKYGDPAKGWAAYNAGPGTVDAAIRQHGENWLQALPQETRNYVRSNLQAGGM